MHSFTDELAANLDRIADFHGITVDPHKVVDIPYAMSALLVREPAALRMVSSYSDLIMQEEYRSAGHPLQRNEGTVLAEVEALMLAHGRDGRTEVINAGSSPSARSPAWSTPPACCA